MKKIKEIVFITSLSFTLVMLINAILTVFSLTTVTTGGDILMVLGTCLLIAIIITLGMAYISFFKEHSLLFSYCVVLVIACGTNYIVYQHFYWSDYLFQIGLLTLVFIGVWLGVYGMSLSEADKINKKLNKISKGNQK